MTSQLEQAAVDGITVEKLVAGFGANDWTRCVLRDSTRGRLWVDVAHRRVWVWDGEEATARCWHLVVRREVGSPKQIKYSLSNAPADTKLECLAEPPARPVRERPCRLRYQGDGLGQGSRVQEGEVGTLAEMRRRGVGRIADAHDPVGVGAANRRMAVLREHHRLEAADRALERPGRSRRGRR